MFLFCGLIFIIQNAQKSKMINPEAPELTVQKVNQLIKIPTNITLPITISIAEIENQINKSVSGLVFEDNSFDDNQKDLLKLKVWKTKDVKIKTVNDELEISIPLKIWAKKGYSVLGFTTYQETEFEMEIKFISKIELNNLWGINSTTRYKEFSWISKPSLKFGMISIPITPFVEKSLTPKLAEFSGKIDTQIEEKIQFKPQVLVAWNQFSKPILVSEEFQTWIKITPISVQTTPLKLSEKEFNTTFGFQVYSETFVGKEPISPDEVKEIPNLSLVKALNSLFLLQTTANISYLKATEMAKEKLQNKEFSFKEGKYKIKLDEIEIYPANEFLVIKSKISGDIKGTTYLKGIPFYDELTQELKLKDVAFDLKTSNLLHKVAAWFLEGKVTSMIQKEYGIPCVDLLNYTKKSITESFNKEHAKGLKLTGKVEELKPSSTFLSAEFMSIIIDTKAKLHLEVKDF